MTTRFDSPLELQQIARDAAGPGSMTAPGQPATCPAAFGGGDDDL